MRKARMPEAIEREDADTARTVKCGICDAAPGRRCQGNGVTHRFTVHVGRLKTAIPKPRPPRYQWLDWHDAFLANPQAPAQHRAEIYEFANIHGLEVTRERRDRD